MLPLAITENKKALRRMWDKPILKMFSSHIGRNLNYIGLPGPDIYDFKDWGDLLAWKTGVERYPRKNTRDLDECRAKVRTMQKNIMLSGWGGQWELRKGEIENIILEGVDVDGITPKYFKIKKGERPELTYDFHNWDLQGGIGYKTKSKIHKRVEAIKKCVEYQRGHPFVFFLTVNVRHTLGDEFKQRLQDTARELGDPTQDTIFRWYSEQDAKDDMERYRQKAVIPLFIRDVAHYNSFDCFCYPPVYYRGYEEHLLHFVYVLTPKGTIFPTFSNQTMRDVLNLPLIHANEGRFEIAKQQHPNFDFQQARSIIDEKKLPVS